MRGRGIREVRESVAGEVHRLMCAEFGGNPQVTPKTGFIVIYGAYGQPDIVTLRIRSWDAEEVFKRLRVAYIQHLISGEPVVAEWD